MASDQFVHVIYYSYTLYTIAIYLYPSYTPAIPQLYHSYTTAPRRRISCFKNHLASQRQAGAAKVGDILVVIRRDAKRSVAQPLGTRMKGG